MTQILYRGSSTTDHLLDVPCSVCRWIVSVLLVFADNDAVSQKHIAEFFVILDRSVKERVCRRVVQSTLD